MTLKQWLRSKSVKFDALVIDSGQPCLCNVTNDANAHDCGFLDKEERLWIVAVLDDNIAVTWCLDD